MDLALSGRRHLVVGASRGIGRAIARTVAAEGGEVFLCARDETMLRATAAELADAIPSAGIDAYPADATDSSDMQQLVAQVCSDGRGIDGLVLCVGDGRGSRLPLPDADAWESEWRTNFESVTTPLRAALPHMAEGGSIVIIGSIAGSEDVGAPTAYATAKAALASLASLLARRLAPDLRVNLVAPGNIHEDGNSWDLRLRADPDAVQRMLRERVPLGRLGRTEEVATSVALLLSPCSSFTTGSVVVIDGGQTVSLS